MQSCNVLVEVTKTQAVEPTADVDAEQNAQIEIIAPAIIVAPDATDFESPPHALEINEGQTSGNTTLAEEETFETLIAKSALDEANGPLIGNEVTKFQYNLVVPPFDRQKWKCPIFYLTRDSCPSF